MKRLHKILLALLSGLLLNAGWLERDFEILFGFIHSTVNRQAWKKDYAANI